MNAQGDLPSPVPDGIRNFSGKIRNLHGFFQPVNAFGDDGWGRSENNRFGRGRFLPRVDIRSFRTGRLHVFGMGFGRPDGKGRAGSPGLFRRRIPDSRFPFVFPQNRRERIIRPFAVSHRRRKRSGKRPSGVRFFFRGRRDFCRKRAHLRQRRSARQEGLDRSPGPGAASFRITGKSRRGRTIRPVRWCVFSGWEKGRRECFAPDSGNIFRPAALSDLLRKTGFLS